MALAINGKMVLANSGDIQLFGAGKLGSVNELIAVHNLSNSSELKASNEQRGSGIQKRKRLSNKCLA